jgi:hypothetical protein
MKYKTSVALVALEIMFSLASVAFNQLRVDSQSGYEALFHEPGTANWAIPLPYVSKDFSLQEKRLIGGAMHQLGQMMYGTPSQSIGSCVDKYAKKDLSPPQTWSQAKGISGLWGNYGIAHGSPLNGRRRRVYIDRINEKSNKLAEAQLGINWRNQDFKIRLNAFKLQESLTAMSNDTRWNPEHPHKWAGTILHEIMHNMGYNHPVIKAGDFTPVISNLTYEAGWCVKRNGKDKSPGSFNLTEDPELFVD